MLNNIGPALLPADLLFQFPEYVDEMLYNIHGHGLNGTIVPCVTFDMALSLSAPKILSTCADSSTNKISIWGSPIGLFC